MGLLEWAVSEWRTLKGAPRTFIFGACLLTSVSWTGASLFYRQELAGARQQRDTAIQQRDLYKQELDSKPVHSPAPVAKHQARAPVPHSRPLDRHLQVRAAEAQPTAPIASGASFSSNGPNYGVVGNVNVTGAVSLPPPSEAELRAQALQQLTHLYILSHNGISPRMMAGMELAPADFLNRELDREHATWRVRSVDGPSAQTYEVVGSPP